MLADLVPLVWGAINIIILIRRGLEVDVLDRVTQSVLSLQAVCVPLAIWVVGECSASSTTPSRRLFTLIGLCTFLGVICHVPYTGRYIPGVCMRDARCPSLPHTSIGPTLSVSHVARLLEADARAHAGSWPDVPELALLIYYPIRLIVLMMT